MNVFLQILPLLGFIAALGAAIYAIGLLIRFVKAHERIARAIEQIASKNG